MSRRTASQQHAIDISEENGVRYLHFGSDWVQGAMRIARPWALALEYTREMMFGLLLDRPTSRPKRILQIGLGSGSLSKFCYHSLPDCRLTVVEINPQVELIARQYFKLPDDPLRLQIVDGCGADFILGGSLQFDWIMVDGFDPDARSGALDTAPFFAACRARLAPDGLFCINLLGRNSGYARSLERIEQAFDQQVLALPPCTSGNAIVLAHDTTARNYPWESLVARAEVVRKDMHLDLRPTLKRLRAQNGDSSTLRF